jgi:putative intracellular protease/amidase
MTARVGVITFPGTLDDIDAARAVRLAGGEAVSLWHADADLKNVDAVIVPGGFSYGDYLRAGAIAKFAPVMGEVVREAQNGLPVLGICNGFQVLCEAGLLPGALTRNEGLHFVCRDIWLEVASTDSAWSTRFEAGADVLVRGGSLRRRREDPRRARRRGPGGLPLPRQPQRLDARHRRHQLRRRPRRRPHAASRARHRGVDRALRRRARPVLLRVGRGPDGLSRSLTAPRACTFVAVLRRVDRQTRTLAPRTVRR